MRKILDFALPNAYSNKLFNINWSIYEKPFKETVDKLVTVKPDIKAETAKVKANKALAKKVYDTKGTKQDNNGKPRVPDANKTICKICNKQHKGECWLKDKSGNASCNYRGGGGGNSAFNKQQMKVMRKTIKSFAKKEGSDSKSE